MFDWPRLVELHPGRAVRLLDTSLTEVLRLPPAERLQRYSALDVHTKESQSALIRLTGLLPKESWDILVRHVRLVREFNRQLRKQLREGGVADVWIRRIRVPRAVIRMLVHAGQVLFREDPAEFLAHVEKIATTPSKSLQRVILRAMRAAPRQYADHVIEYLLQDARRLEVGGFWRPWMPARQVIRKCAPLCSDEVFRRLETTLTTNLDSSWAKRRLRDPESRNKYWSPWAYAYGRREACLLSALPKARMTARGRQLRDSFVHRYRQFPQDLRRHGIRGIGGTVVSPISRERLHKVSDRAWLELMKKALPSRGHGNWTQMDRVHVGESSVQHFARDLGQVAACQPRRFGNLLRAIPSTVDPQYLNAIASALQLRVPPADAPEEFKSDWEPATAEQLEAIMQSVGAADNRESALNFCRILQQRSDANWSDRTLEILFALATGHPDPGPNRDRFSSLKDEDDRVDFSLETEALNSVRGDATYALAALLFSHRDWLPKLTPTLRALVRDTSPAVRTASIELCLAVLNLDRNLAVELFLDAVSCSEERVASCRSAWNFIGYAARTHFQQLEPLIVRMSHSENDGVAESGTGHLAALWIMQAVGQADRVLQLAKGTRSQRKGVAGLAAALVCEPDHFERAVPILLPLMDDEEEKVRKVAQPYLREVDLLAIPGMPAFLRKYADTKAFCDDPFSLLHALNAQPGSLHELADVVFQVCQVFAGPLAEQSRTFAGRIGHEAATVVSLLLRLYEQTRESHQDLHAKCLDAWDLLLENQVGPARNLMHELPI